MANTPRLQNLQAWQKAMDLAVYICKGILPKLPINEQYALVDQLRRAAQSIPANIAEGFGRHHYQEAIRYCYISRGSLVEVFSHLSFAHRMAYLSNETYEELIAQLQDLHKILNGYITYLKNSKQGEHDPASFIREPTSEYTLEIPDDPIF